MIKESHLLNSHFPQRVDNRCHAPRIEPRHFIGVFVCIPALKCRVQQRQKSLIANQINRSALVSVVILYETPEDIAVMDVVHVCTVVLEQVEYAFHVVRTFQIAYVITHFLWADSHHIEIEQLLFVLVVLEREVFPELLEGPSNVTQVEVCAVGTNFVGMFFNHVEQFLALVTQACECCARAD